MNSNRLESNAPNAIDFYFDFSSPYGYFASHLVDAVAEHAGRRAVWRPFMLGSVFKFKEMGAKPLVSVPIKGDYCRRDWERLARLHKVPYVLPDPFPIATLAAARAFYWLDDRNPVLAKTFAKAAFRAYFGDGRNISPAEAVADMAAAAVGVQPSAVLAAVEDPKWKRRLKEEGERAIEQGVCGSPFFIVDGEGFWGCDRLPMVERWLAEGGW